MDDEAPIDLAATPLHLGPGASVRQLPTFDGTMEWYGRYSADTAADGVEGRLVTLHTFDEPWDSWEVHPHGHEVVLCVAGSIRLVQDHGDRRVSVVLGPGQAAVNAPGVWHTADADGSATVLFITAGTGTEHRPR